MNAAQTKPHEPDGAPDRALEDTAYLICTECGLSHCNCDAELQASFDAAQGHQS